MAISAAVFDMRARPVRGQASSASRPARSESTQPARAKVADGLDHESDRVEERSKHEVGVK